MNEVSIPGKEKEEYIDVCTNCHFLWFDAGEYESLPEIEQKPTWQETLPQAARERAALLELDNIRIKAEKKDWGDDNKVPDEFWKVIPAFFGMPVEYSTNQLLRIPWLTWLIAIIVTAISVMAFGDFRNIIDTFGLIPAQADRYLGLTLLTSFFLHGGIFHLVSNMYFFLMFGDNVEDFLGKWRFFFLLLIATLAGDIAHIMGDPSSVTPCIGASGGISGVIAFYALTFPHAKLGLLIRLYIIPIKWIKTPSWALFLIWIILQFVGVWQQLAGFSNVSSLAHLGGAGVGVIFWALFKKTK